MIRRLRNKRRHLQEIKNLVDLMMGFRKEEIIKGLIMVATKFSSVSNNNLNRVTICQNIIVKGRHLEMDTITVVELTLPTNVQIASTLKMEKQLIRYMLQHEKKL